MSLSNEQHPHSNPFLLFSMIVEIYCPPLEAPFRGHITPESCTDERENIRRNTACAYGCVSGHYLAGGSQSLTCQIDGFWQGTVPYCERNYCHFFVTLTNTFSLPLFSSMDFVMDDIFHISYQEVSFFFSIISLSIKFKFWAGSVKIPFRRSFTKRAFVVDLL